MFCLNSYPWGNKKEECKVDSIKADPTENILTSKKKRPFLVWRRRIFTNRNWKNLAKLISKGPVSIFMKVSDDFKDFSDSGEGWTGYTGVKEGKCGENGKMVVIVGNGTDEE